MIPRVVVLSAVCGVAGYVVAAAIVEVSVRATWWREARRVVRELTPPAPLTCPACNGTGHCADCEVCSGTGKVAR